MKPQPSLVQLQIVCCEWCGKPLPQARSHMRNHNGCRQKLSRWRHEQTRRGNDLLTAITALAAYLKFPETRDIAVVQFEEAERALTEAYRAASIARRTR